MAGTRRGFDGDTFRNGIRVAMGMGMPPDTADQPEFHWKDVTSSETPASTDGVPFDPNTVEARTSPTPVKVTCGIRYVDAAGVQTNLGLLTPAGVILSLLDEEYARVEGCDWVVIAGTKYTYLRTAIPGGMFSVASYEMHFETVNQP